MLVATFMFLIVLMFLIVPLARYYYVYIISACLYLMDFFMPMMPIGSVSTVSFGVTYMDMSTVTNFTSYPIHSKLPVYSTCHVTLEQ